MNCVRSNKAFYAVLILLTALVAGNAFFYFIAVKKGESRLASVEAMILAERKELKELHRGLKGGDGLLADSVRADVDAYFKRLPGADSLTKIVGEMHRAAKRNNLKLPAGNYSPEAASDSTVPKYTINFPVEGRYAAIKKFIYDIEAMDYPIAIEDIAFVSGKTEGTIGLNIRISAYYL